MKHLLGQIIDIENALRTEAILLLDYDGTLVPIVKSPELAALSPNTRKLLRSLAMYFKVAIISGRSLVDVKRLVRLKGIYYVGNHGLEISGPKVKLVKEEAKRARPVIAEICRKLRRGLVKIEGAFVEDKGLSASLHYRLVRPGQIVHLKRNFERIVKPYTALGAIKVTHGKKIFEIRPNVEWDKGKAARWIIDVIDPGGELTPIYIGDDQTDEDAFFALRNSGITVLVSKRRKKSHAKFYLKNVGEVKTFLEKLTEMK